MGVIHNVAFYVRGTQRSRPVAVQEIKLKQVGLIRMR